MKFFTNLMLSIVLAGFSFVGAFAQQSKSSQPIKEDVKDAGKASGRVVKKTAKNVKKGAKKVTHKVAEKTEEGAAKVKKSTKP